MRVNKRYYAVKFANGTFAEVIQSPNVPRLFVGRYEAVEWINKNRSNFLPQARPRAVPIQLCELVIRASKKKRPHHAT